MRNIIRGRSAVRPEINEQRVIQDDETNTTADPSWTYSGLDVGTHTTDFFCKTWPDRAEPQMDHLYRQSIANLASALKRDVKSLNPY